MPPLNPYAPPASELSDSAGIDPVLVDLREKHVVHETSLRSTGLLFYLGGGGALLSAAAIGMSLGTRADADLMTAFLVSALLGSGALATGYGLRTLNPKARWAATLYCVPGLLAFPVGSLFSVYVLYLLHAPKGRTVFTERYARARELTPHIKARSSPVAKGILLVLLLALALVLVMSSAGWPD